MTRAEPPREGAGGRTAGDDVLLPPHADRGSDGKGARSTLTPGLATVLFVLVLMVITAILAWPTATTLQGTPYREEPAFRLWALVAASAMLVWLIMSARLWRLGRAWKPHHRGSVRWAPPVLYVALAVAICVVLRAFLAAPLTPPLPVALAVRWWLLLIVGLLAAGPAVLGLWLVYLRLRDLSEVLPPRDAPMVAGESMHHLSALWGYAQQCLVGLVVIVTTGVVATGLLGKALLATGYSPAQAPAAWLLVFGGFLTAVSALVYIPFVVYWRSFVAQLVQAIYPLPESGLPTDEWLGDRNRLRGFLHGDAPLKQTLAGVFGVLAPLGGSVLSVIIPELHAG
jgi:hypothetical protein